MAINSQASLVPSLFLALFPGPERLSLAVQNSRKFVLQATNTQGLGTRLASFPGPEHQNLITEIEQNRF